MNNNKSITPDLDQQNAINININSVVSAGAGSGKTSVLSERFAHLVIDKHIKVNEILTLTFTKKATTEMYGRIYKKLKEKSPESVKDFYKANIMTLDSYCSSIAKNGAHFYGVNPNFTIDNDSVKDSIKSLALPFILKHRNNKALQILIQTKDYENIANELFVNPIIEYSSIACPIDFYEQFKIQRNEVVLAWNKASSKSNDFLYEFKENFEACNTNKDTIFGNKVNSILENEFPEFPELTETDVQNGKYDNLLPFLNYFNEIASVALPRGNNKAWEGVIEILKNMREFGKFLSSIVNYVYGYKTTEEILPLLVEFQNSVNDCKRTAGTLTFKDIADIAVSTLKDYPELRAIEKNKYKSILIDEFQDNNSTQRDLLFMLAEQLEIYKPGIPVVTELIKDKLFFVGDEKQSIYKFRGADVSIFRNLKNCFPNGNLELKTNYRSDPSLVAAFNTIFGGYCFPPKDELFESTFTRPSVFMIEKKNKNIPEYEAVYNKVLLPKSKELTIKDDTYTPHIHLALYKGPDKNTVIPDGILSADETEAFYIAKKIKELIDGKDGKPPVKPNDIAILFRKYSNQPVLERMLLQFGIPYNSEVIKGFFTDGPVNDIFSFLRLCVYPGDRLAYSTLLCSPFVNLSITECEAVMATYTSKQQQIDTSLYNGTSTISLEEQLFSKQQEQLLVGKSKERFNEAGKFFHSICSFSKTAPITQTLNRIWFNTGYRFETLWNKKVEMYNSLYDMMFELARKADESSTGLATFVDGMRTYKDQMSKLDDMDIPIEKGESVHLLTIFKSKGLEFPIVFVSGISQEAQRETNKEVIYFSKQYGLSINTPPCPTVSDKRTNYFFSKIKDIEEQMNGAELRRLTYVALTRAINEVYITGSYSGIFDDKNNYLPDGDKVPRTMYSVLQPILKFYSPFTTNSPLDFEEIQIITRSEQEQYGDFQEKNNETGKHIFIQNKLPLITNSLKYQKEVLSSPYRSPSQLHNYDDETINLKTSQANINKSLIQKKIISTNETIPFSEIDAIIESTIETETQSEPKFSYTNFGTIAHAYLEAEIKNIKPEFSNREISGLSGSKTKLNQILSIAQLMASTFSKSELGRQVSISSWCKAEFNFRSRIDNKIIKGSIDLVFKNAISTDNANYEYTIVDYKTNRYIEPSIYYTQLACYKQAVSAMLNIKPETIRCCLYYLRYGKTIDITKECESINISSEIEKIDLINKEIIC